MRSVTVGCMLLVAVLASRVGTGQVLVHPNPYPDVTAATAAWQIAGEPVFHAGAYYYPAGPIIQFDGDIMWRTGTFNGVPIYEDATQTPFSVVYVPVGRNLVRSYERPREGELAGTTGSRTPSFPVAVDNEAPPERVIVLQAAPPIEASGVVAPVTPPTVPTPRRNVPIILRIWVPFQGARWYNSGAAVPYSADRFIQIGVREGFPVYRQKNGKADEIFIPSVVDGAVAPYRKG
jgi:hypothetical protein